MNLHDYDLIVFNSSGGKDSLVYIAVMVTMAIRQKYPLSRMVVSHQELGTSEWEGTKELVIKQADLFGLPVVFSHRVTKTGKVDTFVKYVIRRGKWPSSKQRWCTSDFKRGPGDKMVRQLCKPLTGNIKVLNCFGFRAQESPARAKREVIIINKRLTTKKRTVFDYLPIHKMSVSTVWKIIRRYKLPYHECYDLGVPRHSCVLCVFSPFDALVVGGRKRPELLDDYIKAEEITGHTFKNKFSLKEVKAAIENNYQPRSIADWKM